MESAIGTATPVLYRDPVSKAPWLFDGDAFWTYEDAVSIRNKAAYVAEQRLGGFMVWELSEDSAAGTLLNAARDALQHPPLTPVPHQDLVSAIPVDEDGEPTP
jgi:chitinase